MTWRDTALTPRFLWVLDARAAFPMALVVVHMRWWTFWLAILSMLAFLILERFGLTVPVLARKLRHRFAGRVRKARPWWYWQRFRTGAF